MKKQQSKQLKRTRSPSKKPNKKIFNHKKYRAVYRAPTPQKITIEVTDETASRILLPIIKAYHKDQFTAEEVHVFKGFLERHAHNPASKEDILSFLNQNQDIKRKSSVGFFSLENQ